jgi:PRC-barrel domain
MRIVYVRVALAAITLCMFGGASSLLADSSTETRAGGGMSSSDRVPSDKMTDLTGGQQGVPDAYATTPVRQGTLTEVTDNKWLNQEVTNKQGETLGKITKVLKDQKTQKEEYVLLEIADSQEVRPLPWAHFKQQGDRVTLNATKDELLPSVNRSDTKDLSPDLAMFMDQVEQKRAESKPKVGRGDGRGTDRPAPSAGPMGEQEAAGDLGPRGASPGDAPGFEREGQKKQ